MASAFLGLGPYLEIEEREERAVLPADQATVLRTIYEWRYVGRLIGDERGTEPCRLEAVPANLVYAELRHTGIDTLAALELLKGKQLVVDSRASLRVFSGRWTLPDGRILQVEDISLLVGKQQGSKFTISIDSREILMGDLITPRLDLTAHGIETAERILAEERPVAAPESHPDYAKGPLVRVRDAASRLGFPSPEALSMARKRAERKGQHHPLYALVRAYVRGHGYREEGVLAVERLLTSEIEKERARIKGSSEGVDEESLRRMVHRRLDDARPGPNDS